MIKPLELVTTKTFMNHTLIKLLTSADTRVLIEDAEEHEYNRIPMREFLDFMDQQTKEGKLFLFLPVMRHNGMHGHEHVRSKIIMDGEIQSFIDNSYSCLRDVFGMRLMLFKSLPSDQIDQDPESKR